MRIRMKRITSGEDLYGERGLRERELPQVDDYYSDAKNSLISCHLIT
jgi:hypothetical protein